MENMKCAAGPYTQLGFGLGWNSILPYLVIYFEYAASVDGLPHDFLYIYKFHPYRTLPKYIIIQYPYYIAKESNDSTSLLFMMRWECTGGHTNSWIEGCCLRTAAWGRPHATTAKDEHEGSKTTVPILPKQGELIKLLADTVLVY